MLFRLDQYFYFRTVIAENATLHRYVAQNSRSMFRATSDVVGSSVLTISQKSFSDFFYEPQLSNTNAVFKIKHSNPMRSQGTLI